MPEFARSTRRALLRTGAQALAAATALPALRAQAGGAYRAVVCIYLNGGNDSNNMVAPLDADGYSAYASVRGALALPAKSLLPISSGTQSYGLHPALGDLADLYRQGKMAIAANVGGPRSGKHVTYHTSASEMAYLPDGFLEADWAHRWADATGSARAVYTFRSGISLVTPGAPVFGTGVHENIGLRAAMDSASGLNFPDDALGRALRDVAALASIASSWGMSRQVFTVPFFGFDTHSNQLTRQEALFRTLNRSVTAFYRTAERLGIAEQTAIYTDTEFSRTLAPNRTGGTEHGWGGHQLVIGGPMRGGAVYGTFPELTADRGGIWTPTTTRAQFTGEIAEWAGAEVSRTAMGLLR